MRVGENVLATAGRDGCVRVWDVRDGGAKAAGVYRSGMCCYYFVCWRGTDEGLV